MTQLEDRLENKVSLSPDWHSQYTVYAKDGIPFRLVWNYPLKLRLSNGKYITLNSYIEHHQFVKQAVYNYKFNKTP